MIKKNETAIGIALILLEVSLILTFLTFAPYSVTAAIGINNVSVITNLTIGNVYPDIVNVSINEGNPIALIPNSTKLVSCIAVLRDYNGESDIVAVNATFYDPVNSTFTAADDKNNHYTNSSCQIINDIGIYNTYNTSDIYHAIANCTFEIEYYANPENWICHAIVNDTMSWIGENQNTQIISPLLALGLPDIIDYGTVNATEVSSEQQANVTNYGNVQVNLTLEGYGGVEDDDLAMVCSLGNIGTIDVEYEKYNLTQANPGQQTLTQFNTNYTNLTSSGAVPVRRFELDYRKNDVVNNAVKESYWRIYVPLGVAGQCNGTIIFGATTAPAS